MITAHCGYPGPTQSSTSTIRVTTSVITSSSTLFTSDIVSTTASSSTEFATNTVSTTTTTSTTFYIKSDTAVDNNSIQLGYGLIFGAAVLDSLILSAVVVVVAVMVLGVVVVMVVMMTACICRRRRQHSLPALQPIEMVDIRNPTVPPRVDIQLDSSLRPVSLQLMRMSGNLETYHFGKQTSVFLFAYQINLLINYNNKIINKKSTTQTL